MTAGIVGYGAYVPRLRMSRQAIYDANAWFAPGLKSKAKGSRSLANWDEDATTMAVAAARDSLPVTHGAPSLKAVIFASTTFTFADRLNAGVIAAALNLDEKTDAIDIGSSRRAGLSALRQALSSSRGGEAPILVTAADLRRTRAASASEMEFGDAAATLLVGTQDVIAEPLGFGTVTVDFVDHFRQSGEEIDYVWEERWIRDEGLSKIAPRAAAAALADAGLSGADVDHFIFASSSKGMAAQVARGIGVPAEAVTEDLMGQIGDTGVGHGLLLLAGVLEVAKPGAVILSLEFGNGAEAIVWRTTDRIKTFKPRRGLADWLSRGVPETSYTRLLAYRGQLELEKGMRGELDKKTALTTLYRHRTTIMGLVAGRCRETGSVHFPPSRLSYDPRGAALDTQEPYFLADRRAHILSWSAEALSYHLSPPQHYGQIDFEGGGRILLEFTDVSPGDVETGTPMEAVFRVKDRDLNRGFTRYFWKATPVRGDHGGTH